LFVALLLWLLPLPLIVITEGDLLFSVVLALDKTKATTLASQKSNPPPVRYTSASQILFGAIE